MEHQENLLISVDNFAKAGPGAFESATFTMGFKQRHSPSLINLFSNRDVLAKRLKNRLDRDELISRHIIPALSSAPVIYEKAAQLKRKKTADLIQRKIRVRPSRRQLIDRHILNDSKADPSLQERLEKLERLRIADHLNERLAIRPGPIELIHEHILAVEDKIATAIEHGDVMYESTCGGVLSPSSYSDGSPTGLSDIESSISELNCTSPSPPPSDDVFSNAFKAYNDSLIAAKAGAEMALVDVQERVSPANQEAVVPILDHGKLIADLASCSVVPKPMNYQSAALPISVSQKENEELVRSFFKKPKQSKVKVKKLKFHEYGPPYMKPQSHDAPLDDRYKRLLEQQTLYLRLQVMQKNAMLNALRGNAESMDAVTEAIENAIESKLEQEKSPVSQNGSVTDGMSRKSLDDLRVTELRAQCKQRGLIVSGPKAKLIERLKAYESGQSLSSDFSQNHILQNSFDKSGLVPLSTSSQSALSPIYASGIHETSYAPCSRQQPSQSRIAQPAMAFAGTGTPQTQLRIQHIEAQPVVRLAEPHMATGHNSALFRSSSASHVGMEPASLTSPLASTLARSPSLQFQFSPPRQPHAPPIVLQPMPHQQLQRALVRQKVQPSCMPVYSQETLHSPNSLVIVPSLCSTYFPISQSVPPDVFFRHGMVLSCEEFQSSIGGLTSVASDEPTRGRAASEPANTLRKKLRTARSKKEALASPISSRPCTPPDERRLMSPTANVVMPDGVSTKFTPESGACQSITSQSMDQENKSLDQVYEDIMEIIGGISTPSPDSGRGGSPLSAPNSGQPSPNLEPKQEMCSQPFLCDGKPKTPVSKFLAANQQRMKAFNSLPSDMNYLGVSPVPQQTVRGGCNSFGGSDDDLSVSCGNLAGSQARRAGSCGNLSAITGNLLNASDCFSLVPGFCNSNLSLSTDNIPQSNLYDGLQQNFTHGYYDSRLSVYMSPVSPMNIEEQALMMELENLPSVADPSWLSLNCSSGSSPLLNSDLKVNNLYRASLPIDGQSLQEFYGACRTGHFSMFGNSPSRHDEYGAMFDMEAAAEF